MHPLAIGGRTHITHIIAKRDTKGSSAQITAEDIQLDSEYLCPVQIGTPAQTLMLDFDTGSSDLWASKPAVCYINVLKLTIQQVWSTELPSSTQTQGGQTGHNIFDPSNSSTFKKMSGFSWKISYADGSGASGDVGTDNVSVGTVTIREQAIELAKSMSSQFIRDTGDGLLGLAWPKINTVKPEPVATPVQNMITQDDIPQSAELFTAYLGSWRDTNDPDQGGSFYTFGEIDQEALNGQTPAYTHVDNRKGFWMFPSTSVSINDQTTDRSGNKAIADTGTTLCLVDDNTVTAIYDAIPGSTYDNTQQGYVFPANTTADQLPDVAFPVGDTLIHIQKEDLGFADAGNGMVFGGIQSRGSNPFDILGDVFLKSAYVVSTSA